MCNLVKQLQNVTFTDSSSDEVVSDDDTDEPNAEETSETDNLVEADSSDESQGEDDMDPEWILEEEAEDQENGDDEEKGTQQSRNAIR